MHEHKPHAQLPVLLEQEPGCGQSASEHQGIIPDASGRSARGHQGMALP